MAIGKNCKGGQTRVETGWFGRLIVSLVVGSTALASPLLGQKGKICADDSPACQLLRTWYAQGTASGNHGDFYDNRDRGHARVKFEGQQIQTVQYSEADRRSGRDYSGPQRVRPHITVGNASLAAPVDKGGSIPRLFYYTKQRGIDFLYTLYRKNNLYIFPEHRDHDPGRGGVGGHGDLFPLNTPYLVISQGSSGSDMPFVRAFVKTLAALRPPVKQELARAGLLAPTLQMILRWCNKGIQSDSAYLTGKAHPTVFKGKNLDVEQMVRFAHEIGVESLPPLVQLKVVDEETAENGRDYFGLPDASEILSDTPSAIARIFRRINGPMRMTVSAAGSVDANRRALRFEWVVLRGDPARVRIEPRNGGREAHIEVDYHHWRRNTSEIGSGRVDIGVFAYNGIYYSAPAFISFAPLDNENRVYDQEGRPLLVQYEAGEANLHLQAVDYKYWDRIFAALDAEPLPLEGRLLAARLGTQKLGLLHELAGQSASLRHEYARLRAVGDSLTVLKKRKEKSEREAAGNAEELARIRQEKNAIVKRITHLNKVEFAPVEAKVRALLTRPLTDAGETPRQILRTALEAVADDLTLYPLHVEAIHKQIKAVGDRKKKGRERLWNLRLQLVEDGVLHELPDNRLMLDPQRLRQGVDALTRHRFRLLNLTLMAYFLYPDIVLPQLKPNYVDTRLAKRKRWQDLYHYDADGKFKGWTRLLGAGRKAQYYSPEGLLVVERAADDTPLKGRTVRYAAGKNGYLEPQPVGPSVPLR